MDEAESNPNSETPNLNVNESEKKTEIKDTCKTEQVSTESKLKREAIVQSVETAVEKSGETKEKNMEDDDGEDLPDNFFDDFSNNDFMAGLNIVDDWMDDEEDPEKKRGRDDYFQDDVELRARSSERRPDLKRDNRRESSPRHRARYGDRDHHMKRDRFSRDDERLRRQRDRDFDRRRSRDRDFERRRSRSHDRFREERRSRERFRSRDKERSRPKEHDRPLSEIRDSKNDSKDRPLEENIDARRDPEKTKRDIQRDKLRCAKDFEARVFQEQLKVAETGLVPPGTELDVVMEHEKRKFEEQQSGVENPSDYKKEEVLPSVRLVEKKRSVERFRGRDKTHSKSRGRHSRERHSRDRHSRERRSRERHSRERHSRERDLRVRRSRERDLRSRDRDLRDRRSRDRDLRDRRFSPDFRPRKREYDRFHRSRDRSVSPRFQRRSRSIAKEEMYRRNDDLRLRIREKRRERYFNELSPVSEAKFSRSPSLTNLSLISNISEREFWLRNRDKYKSRYGRSCSPISSSSLSDLGSPRRKRSRKASFMEEIERKLRERARTRNTSTTNYGSPVVSNPDIPKPVSSPLQFQQQMPLNMPFQSQNPQMYQQGMVQSPYPQPQVVDHGMMMHQHQHQHQPMPLMSLMTAPPTMGTMGGTELLGLSPTVIEQPMLQMHQHQVVNPMQVQQQTALNSPIKLDSSLHRTASNLKPCVSDANKEVTKLFEEQKISLSDYLSVSAKPIDPKSPVINVHRKIKVISKCQDVIRVLKDDSKFCGRFFPRPAPVGIEKQEEKSMKWKSPLRKTFPVRFMFTTPSKKPPIQQDFVKNIINKLLFVCGIPALPGSDPLTLSSVRAKTENANTSSKTLQNISMTHVNFVPKPIPPPISFSVSQQKPKNTPLPQQSVLIKRSTIGLQTDPVKCQICEIRSARKFSDHGCQTNEKDMVDESTQVTNEDLQKSMVTFTPRGILKNSSSSVQSLSHLTPAQLLSLQQEKSDDGWNLTTRNDTFSVSRNTQDQFSNTPGGNFMGRSSGNTPLNSNFNIGSGMNNPNINRLSTNIPGNNFNSSFSGSMDKLSFSNMQNRSFSGQHGNQPSMNSGNSMNDFQSMASRNADNRPGNFDRFPNDKYSPEQSFNDSNNINYNNRNMSGNMGNPMNSNRGRGGTTNRGFFMNYGGQNRPFYNN